MIVTKPNDLTPVENHNGVYYKRDDLFQPYDDMPINGGKVRQCISLVENNLEHIRRDCNSTIATASSIESPQGIIIARVAKEYGLKSVLAVGGGTDVNKLLDKHRLLRACQSIGCDIRAVNKLGYNSVLYSKLQEMQKTEKFFMAMFGINVDSNPDSILGTTMRQVDNLPLDKINKIIVPVGSALMFTAILMALHKKGWLEHNKCIGIQIANTDRKKTIDGILGKAFFMEQINYDFILDPTYKYHTYVKSNILGTDIALDPIYEAKAHEYAIKHNMLTEGSLYWVVGNSMLIRERFNK